MLSHRVVSLDEERHHCHLPRSLFDLLPFHLPSPRDGADMLQVRVDKVEYRRPDPPKDQTTPIPKPEVPAGW